MRVRHKLGIFLALAALLGLVRASFAAEPLVWKPVVNCVLRVDERPAKIWEVYVVPKKKNLVLIQLGARFLQLDTDAKEIYEIAPEALERKGSELLQKAESPSPPANAAAAAAKSPTDPAQGASKNKTLLPSADWFERDAGRARIIRLRLTAEGRRLEVQLPIAPDLRKLY